jgi:hypothetical protein
MARSWIKAALSSHGLPAREERLSVVLGRKWSKVSLLQEVNGAPRRQISFKCRTELANALLRAFDSFGFWSIRGYATNGPVYDGVELNLAVCCSERVPHSVHIADPGHGAPNAVRDLFEFGCSLLDVADSELAFVGFLERLREPGTVEWFKKHWTLP